MKQLLTLLGLTLLYSCAPMITKPRIGEEWVLKSSKKKNMRIVTILNKTTHITTFSADSIYRDTTTRAFMKNYTRYTLSGQYYPLQRH